MKKAEEKKAAAQKKLKEKEEKEAKAKALKEEKEAKAKAAKEKPGEKAEEVPQPQKKEEELQPDPPAEDDPKNLAFVLKSVPESKHGSFDPFKTADVVEDTENTLLMHYLQTSEKATEATIKHICSLSGFNKSAQNKEGWSALHFASRNFEGKRQPYKLFKYLIMQ